ncbi:MAG: diphthamide biosynthesis enzyme Dph2 [Desulfurococcaceae archaeon]|nr:diphthamide biosynthesis enzyme Dph2 [Desulfurococcaceae archaeon]
MSQRDICDLYNIRLNSILEKLKALKTRKILLHAPDGLKSLYKCLESALRELGVEVFYSSEPAYGACDIPLEEARITHVNVVLHIGHEEYVLQEQDISAEIKVFYIPVYYTVKLEENVLEYLYKLLVDGNIKNVTVSSTLIESLQRKQVAQYLREKGLNVHEISTPILGCYYGPIAILDSSVDAHVVVSGGVFHPIGVGLISNKPIIVVDPYSQRVWLAREEVDRVLKKRFFLLLKARDLFEGKLGLIIGGRPGQFRPALVEYLENIAKTFKFKVYKIVSSYLTLDRLIAIDNGLQLDLYVVASCPRLPIDDLAEFYKPVLTPGEFIMLIARSEKYIYPW